MAQFNKVCKCLAAVEDLIMRYKSLISWGTTIAALGLLAACGGSGDASQNAGGADEIVSFAAEPTITPNAEPLDSTHPNSIQPETTLSISATGNVDVEPDIAFITAGVNTDADTAAKAMADNAQAMNGVFSALERAGVAENDMQTSNFSLQPRYDYSSRGNNPPKVVGYTASNQLSVKVRDLDNLGQTMDALVEAGGNTFSGLRFALDDDRATKNQARQLAMRDAIARAELYAAAAGYQVARIVTISETVQFDQSPMPMMQMRSVSAEASTPIAAGEVGYAITVNVVFELRQ